MDQIFFFHGKKGSLSKLLRFQKFSTIYIPPRPMQAFRDTFHFFPKYFRDLPRGKSPGKTGYFPFPWKRGRPPFVAVSRFSSGRPEILLSRFFRLAAGRMEPVPTTFEHGKLCASFTESAIDLNRFPGGGFSGTVHGRAHRSWEAGCSPAPAADSSDGPQENRRRPSFPVRCSPESWR